MAARGSRFLCECFFTRNIFLKDYGVHVVFEDQSQFMGDYARILEGRGCTTDDQWEAVFAAVKNEVNRRKALGQDSQRRKEILCQRYKPLHPHLYTLQESFLADSFLRVVQYARSAGADAAGLRSLIKECGDFVEEVCHFEACDVPKGRPNTMNNYGVLLDELGFDANFFDPLREIYLMPITKLLYAEWGGDALDSHKAFIVQYKIGEDVDLGYHYDNAEVTLNVSLGTMFTGGALYFTGLKQESMERVECVEVEHTPTHGLLHRGQHMHAALPIHSGHRCNLVMWMRASKIRNKLCPMCDHAPRLVPTLGCGDGFTSVETVAVCAAL